jgi:hypothetical protein
MRGNFRVSTVAVAMAMALVTSACAASTSSPSPVQNATAAPTSVPTATAAPTPSPTPVPTLPNGLIPPGTYQAGFVTYTLPAGWTTFNSEIILTDGSNPPNGMAIALWQDIGTVYKDPCHADNSSWSANALTVDALVAALVAQKRGSAVTPTNVTIDGLAAKQIDLMVPLDVNIAACDRGSYTSWTTTTGGDRFNQGPGQHDLIDILAVNGRTSVIQRSFYPANTAADLAELQAIIDSIKITTLP